MGRAWKTLRVVLSLSHGATPCPSLMAESVAGAHGFGRLLQMWLCLVTPRPVGKLWIEWPQREGPSVELVPQTLSTA